MDAKDAMSLLQVCVDEVHGKGASRRMEIFIQERSLHLGGEEDWTDFKALGGCGGYRDDGDNTASGRVGKYYTGTDGMVVVIEFDGLVVEVSLPN